MSLIEDLRKIKTFEDLPEDQLAWLAEKGTEIRLAPGELLTRAGDPADRMIVVLEGELQFRRDGSFVTNLQPGAVSGLLPFSRMTHFPVTGVALTAARVVWFSSSIFPEMCQRMPPLIGRPRNDPDGRTARKAGVARKALGRAGA